MAQKPPVSTQSQATSAGLVDLEKELSCSICTDILYQPLTLLDCLHTFCGSCLKEWFSWQRRHVDQEDERSHHTRPRHRRKPYPYTCPSCRAAVKQTRANATVTTLLDMYLAANPVKKKTQEEKSSTASMYKPGEEVLLQPGSERGESRTEGIGGHMRDSAEEEDRRLMEHVQQMSLRDAGVVSGTAHTLQIDGSSHRRASRSPARAQDMRTGVGSHNPTQSRALQLGHQSSLRSLLSPYDSDEMREEILRQITEEGLLDDVDWDNIQVEQEDELSERIAEAYRRRRRHRSRQRTDSSEGRAQGRERARHSSAQRRPRHSRNSSASANATNDSNRPPVSRPHLFEPENGEPRRHARSSSQSATNSSRPGSSSSLAQPAARSATDLTERPQSRDNRNERPGRTSHETRRSTDPDGVSVSEQWRTGGAMPTSHHRPRPERRRASQPTTGHHSGATFNGSPAAPHAETLSSQQQPLYARTFPPQPQSQQHGQPRTSSIDAPTPTITVSCDRCNRYNIQNNLHYTCTRCGPPGSTFDLCLQCYRLGHGCLHWFGFGHAAWHRWERKAPRGSEPPHILRSQKYIDLLPSSEAERPSNNHSIGNASREPMLQLGVFCDVCHNNANSCYWHCARCNDGEWGYCHRCVNKARHCSHPLLPVALESSTPTTAPATTNPDNPNPPSPHSSTPTPAAQLHPLVLPTTCNICASSIYTHEQRLHCPDCADGDYDVCLRCYERLTAPGGIISPENGMNGERKCSNGPNGHRMLLVDFAVTEGAAGYAWRRVLQGPVGGWGRELNSPAPANARGKRVEALWPWVPDEGGDDDLSFPRAALLEEVVEINDEFSWGVFCRAGGYFPSAYVRAV